MNKKESVLSSANSTAAAHEDMQPQNASEVVSESESDQPITGDPSSTLSSQEKQTAALLQEQIVALQQALHEQKAMHADQLLRRTAEWENLKRRFQQETEKQRKFSLETLIGDLLPVLDNLERALSACQVDTGHSNLSSLIEGVQLTLAGCVDVLKKHGLTVVDAVGVPFDPVRHQAMLTVSEGEFKANQVVSVLQKGYLLHERLLRPALVSVYKPKD